MLISHPPRSTGISRWLSRRVLAAAPCAALVLGGGSVVAAHATSNASRANLASVNPAAPAQGENGLGAIQQSLLTSCDRGALTAGFQNDAFRLSEFGLPPPLLTFTCVYGTVTAASSSRLIVRTLDGTITVTRGAMTLYDSAGATIGAGDVHDGDVIGVRPVRALFQAPGQLDAETITVETGTFFGRVQFVRAGTLTIVTALGQIATVVTNQTTRFTGDGDAAALHDAAPGTEILAQGHQTGPDSLVASRLIIG